VAGVRVVVIVAVKVVVVLGGVWAVGQALAHRRTVGDETADEFAIASYVGGAQRTCRAASLRRGAVSVVCGGVDLDLRQAALDPAGAALELSATCGGVSLTVPTDWRVVVEDRATLGGVDARVTPPEELPDDAPTLHVEARARLGGVSIRAAEAADASSRSDHNLRGWAST
jgi:hypothetical protein